MEKALVLLWSSPGRASLPLSHRVSGKRFHPWWHWMRVERLENLERKEKSLHLSPVAAQPWRDG